MSSPPTPSFYKSTDTIGSPPTPSLFTSTDTMGAWYPTVLKGTRWSVSTIHRTYIFPSMPIVWPQMHKSESVKQGNTSKIYSPINKKRNKRISVSIKWLTFEYTFPTGLNINLPFYMIQFRISNSLKYYRTFLYDPISIWVHQNTVLNTILICMYVYAPNTYIPASLLNPLIC